ncbi:hypothetical protein GW17_00034802, partial [Ensete ventricosum]
ELDRGDRVAAASRGPPWLRRRRRQQQQPWGSRGDLLRTRIDWNKKSTRSRLQTVMWRKPVIEMRNRSRVMPRVYRRMRWALFPAQEKDEQSLGKDLNVLIGFGLFELQGSPGSPVDSEEDNWDVSDDEDHRSGEESDSSEEEVGRVPSRNTIGDVPLEWYKDEEHIGYDVAGRKIKKQARRDRIESFLAGVDDAKNW